MGSMEDTVILSGREMVQAQWATSAVLGVVLAEHGATFDRWVVLDTLATGAVPPERARFVPGLAAALATGPAAVEVIIDEADEAGLVRIVSAPGGDPGAVRAELTPAGRVQHETLHEALRSAIALVAAELDAGIPDPGLATAHRMLAEVSR
jgi:hypothetical protein